jgi:hypothetical protein
VTRRLAEFSAQKAAREAHRNEQALARTRLRLSRRPIFDAGGKPHFWDLLAGHAGRRASCAVRSLPALGEGAVGKSTCLRKSRIAVFGTSRRRQRRFRLPRGESIPLLPARQRALPARVGGVAASDVERFAWF